VLAAARERAVDCTRSSRPTSASPPRPVRCPCTRTRRYRLGRIAELTGRDPRKITDLL